MVAFVSERFKDQESNFLLVKKAHPSGKKIIRTFSPFVYVICTFCGSIFKPCHIQIHVVMNRVTKRFASS